MPAVRVPGVLAGPHLVAAGLWVYYVHRGTDFTLENFLEVLAQEIVLKALFNSFMIATLATCSRSA